MHGMKRGIQVQVQYVAVEMAPENYKVAKTQKTEKVQEVDHDFLGGLFQFQKQVRKNVFIYLFSFFLQTAEFLVTQPVSN